MHILKDLISLGPSIPLLGERAYLDPGSGSFLIQLLVAGVVGALFIFRGYLGKIKSLFIKSEPEEEEDEPENEQ
jgi:hypothetical protein